MKLRRLLLQAYGPFTNAVLDFGESGANLHIVYGPNEAGKSSALRAMTDLRFGIPLRSADDFVHPSNQLRITGVFVDAQGTALALTRRKGRGATLHHADPDSGAADMTQTATAEQQRALTGGLERAEFEAMFGLNHARLRQGGDLLLRGEGELGAALFEASAGTRSIAALLAGLDADAKQLYNPHGRAQNAVVNEARRQFDEQRQRLRDALIKPADWQSLSRTHEAAKARVVEVETALARLRRQENELTELRTVEPLLREHDRNLADYENFRDAPELAETAREQRLAAEQSLQRAQRELQEAQVEVQRCGQALAELSVEEQVLQRGDAIERLAATVETATRSRIETQQLQAQIEQMVQTLAVQAGRIAPAQTLAAVLGAAPSQADRVGLSQHLGEMSRIEERLAAQRQRLAALQLAAGSAAQEEGAALDTLALEGLLAALRRAQALGDVARQQDEQRRQRAHSERLLAQSLADLGVASIAELRAAQPLLDAQISHTQQALTDVADALRQRHDEDEHLARDLEAQTLRQRELAAAGEVITAETLHNARGRRDQEWQRIRQIYIERDADTTQRALEYAGEENLPEAFERAQQEADRQADLLRADTQRAAALEACSGRISQLQQRCATLAHLCDELQRRKAAIEQRWHGQLQAARLPALAPAALKEWQIRREQTLQVDERLAALLHERDRLLDEVRMAAAALRQALQRVGDRPVDGEGVDGFSQLLAHAALCAQRATEAQAAQQAQRQALRVQRSELAHLQVLVAQTESQLAAHRASLRAWHERLFLDAGSTPETVKARLDELDALERQAARLDDTRLRQAHHQALLDELRQQAEQLAAELREPPPAHIDEFAEQLRRRLALARQQQQRQDTLRHESSLALDKQQRAQAELGRCGGQLATLCAQAGVASIDQLPACERAAARKRQLQHALTTLSEQLGQASYRALEELREALAGQDAVAMDSARERCRLEIGIREHELIAARQAEELARRELEAVDASDQAATAREAMEAAAARCRAAIWPWARLRLAHALLRDSLSRFRERAQAPMIAAASDYFALMTGARYTRLLADEVNDKPTLRAQRHDGARIGVDAMSEGTADQLYLALRLAALRLRAESQPVMPLILDDVLITSDDTRAANMLRALAGYAEHSQVLLFTHHRHLLDVARATLGEHAVRIHTLPATPQQAASSGCPA